MMRHNTADDEDARGGDNDVRVAGIAATAINPCVPTTTPTSTRERRKHRPSCSSASSNISDTAESSSITGLAPTATQGSLTCNKTTTATRTAATEALARTAALMRAELQLSRQDKNLKNFGKDGVNQSNSSWRRRKNISSVDKETSQMDNETVNTNASAANTTEGERLRKDQSNSSQKWSQKLPSQVSDQSNKVHTLSSETADAARNYEHKTASVAASAKSAASPVAPMACIPKTQGDAINDDIPTKADTNNKTVHVWLPLEYQPSELDVICGRGKTCFWHQGNVKFRNLIERMADRYSNCGEDKMAKVMIVTQVLEEVHHPGSTNVDKQASGSDSKLGQSHEEGDAADEGYCSSKTFDKPSRTKCPISNSTEQASPSREAESSNAMQILQPCRGMFVRKDAERNQWYEIDDLVAREKVSSAFRDVLHDKYSSSSLSKKRRRKEKVHQQQLQRLLGGSERHEQLQRLLVGDYDPQREQLEMLLSAGQRDQTRSVRHEEVAYSSSGDRPRKKISIDNSSGHATSLWSNSRDGESDDVLDVIDNIKKPEEGNRTRALQTSSITTAFSYSSSLQQANRKEAPSVRTAARANELKKMAISKDNDEHSRENGINDNEFRCGGKRESLLLPKNQKPREDDVLCGPGSHAASHPGNLKYQKFITGLSESYANANATEKKQIVDHTLHHVWSKGGRFLKVVTESGRWFEVDSDVARTETSHAFHKALRLEEEKLLSWQIKARQGDSEAQYQLGLCYKTGHVFFPSSGASADGYSETGSTPRAGIIARNMTWAAEWFEKAAQRGHPQAQFEIAHCYHLGDGVEQNMSIAAQWYCQAAARFYFSMHRQQVLDMTQDFDLVEYMNAFQSLEAHHVFERAFKARVVHPIQQQEQLEHQQLGKGHPNQL